MFRVRRTWTGAYLFHFLVKDFAADLVCAGAEEYLLDDLNVETFVVLKI